MDAIDHIGTRVKDLGAHSVVVCVDGETCSKMTEKTTEQPKRSSNLRLPFLSGLGRFVGSNQSILDLNADI
jgi:hypothetical protein